LQHTADLPDLPRSLRQISHGPALIARPAGCATKYILWIFPTDIEQETPASSAFRIIVGTTITGTMLAEAQPYRRSIREWLTIMYHDLWAWELAKWFNIILENF
jgi:hypothetical protein